KIMEMANQLRSNMEQAQADAEKLRVSGEAGAGLVQVDMNGKFEVLAVRIDKNAVDLNDLALLEDLVRGAVNQATTKVGEQLKTNMGSMASQLGVDPSALFGGGQ